MKVLPVVHVNVIVHVVVVVHPVHGVRPLDTCPGIASSISSRIASRIASRVSRVEEGSIGFRLGCHKGTQSENYELKYGGRIFLSLIFNISI